jgi:glycosyltransferase involved in cell wall biosynthesis
MELDGKEMIEDEVTGLLVKDNEWFNAFEDLILNKEKRLWLGENAYNYVKDTWQYNSDNITKKVEEVLGN